MRKLSFLPVTLLASLAACSGGGGNSDPPGVAATTTNGAAASAEISNTNPAGPTGSISGTATVSGYSFGDCNPCNEENIANSTGASSVSWTKDNNFNPQSLTVNATENGAAFSRSFDLTQAVQGDNGLFTVASADGSLLYYAGAAEPVGTNGDTSLDYMTFGLWAVDGGTGGQVGVFSAGQETPTSKMPTTGTATYSGSTVGTMYVVADPTNNNNSSSYSLVGTSNATADFGAHSVNGSVALSTSGGSTNTAWSQTMNFNGAITGNQFAGSTSLTASKSDALNAGNMAGAVAGSFYGPSAPSEIGGTYNLSGTNASILGAFGARMH